MRNPTESDFRRAGLVFDCCSSCHMDEEEGYPISWINEPNGAGESWEVCCQCANAFDSLSDEEQARMWAIATQGSLSPSPAPVKEEVRDE